MFGSLVLLRGLPVANAEAAEEDDMAASVLLLIVVLAAGVGEVPEGAVDGVAVVWSGASAVLGVSADVSAVVDVSAASPAAKVEVPVGARPDQLWSG